ncbi:MAG: phytanoyl-CoA dioxygenase family protein [Pseudomonadota bacterium]
MTPRITPEHIAHYHAHGYVLVENFLTPEELARTREELQRIVPGWIEYADNPDGQRPNNWNEPPRSRRTLRFPFAGDQLNANSLHPELLRFAATINGHADLVCEQSDLTYKCTGHYADVEQTMHMDFGNHTLAYPSSDRKFWQTACLMYYTDVDEHSAPTAVVPWQHYEGEVHWPAAYEYDQRPQLYDKEVKATCPAGSVLIYSMRTFHRGTSFSDERARVGQFITFAPKDCPWLGIVGWPEQGIYKSFTRWMEQSTQAQREMLGFPPPEHEYWTREMIDGVQARFPNLDMTLYENALAK